MARTDRNHEYFQGEDNAHLATLQDVLMTYNMFNFDLGSYPFLSLSRTVCVSWCLGYVQGMNDLLSPILIVMENEVEAFWCFVGLMERMVDDSLFSDSSAIGKWMI